VTHLRLGRTEPQHRATRSSACTSCWTAWCQGQWSPSTASSPSPWSTGLESGLRQLATAEAEPALAGHHHLHAVRAPPARRRPRGSTCRLPPGRPPHPASGPRPRIATTGRLGPRGSCSQHTHTPCSPAPASAPTRQDFGRRWIQAEAPGHSSMAPPTDRRCSRKLRRPVGAEQGRCQTAPDFAGSRLHASFRLGAVRCRGYAHQV
jgi:hypothetical protein